MPTGKKYATPGTEAPMASEPVVAVHYNTSHPYVPSLKTQELSFDADDAPCQLTIEDVKSILPKDREDYFYGHYHTMAEVGSIMDIWC